MKIKIIEYIRRYQYSRKLMTARRAEIQNNVNKDILNFKDLFENTRGSDDQIRIIKV